MREAAEAFGAQCIVIAVDAKSIGPGKFEIFTHGGREPTGIDAVQWSQRMAAYGAGEILLTSMDRDGTKQGFNIPLTRAVADAVPIPVIASGGVGTLDHMVEGITEGHASAVLAASIFHFGTFTIGQTKAHMAASGVSVRDAPQAPWSEIERRQQWPIAAASSTNCMRLSPAGGAPILANPTQRSFMLTVGPRSSASSEKPSRYALLRSAKAGTRLIAESGDLLYHLLVLWADQGITPDQIWAELETRFGTSGIIEKASRTTTPTLED